MPIRAPISLIIKIAVIVTTKPTIPVVIFFLALSSAFLSPPDARIPMAPVMKEKTNQIMAIIVMSPTVEEMNLLNISMPLPVPLAAPLGAPSGPKPVKLPFGAKFNGGPAASK